MWPFSKPKPPPPPPRSFTFYTTSEETLKLARLEDAHTLALKKYSLDTPHCTASNCDPLSHTPGPIEIDVLYGMLTLELCEKAIQEKQLCGFKKYGWKVVHKCFHYEIVVTEKLVN